MPKMAIGLFENAELARQVRSDLENCGCAPRDIRIIAEPVAMNDSDPNTGMSTPHTDFEVELVRQLTRMGVERSEAMASSIGSCTMRTAFEMRGDSMRKNRGKANT